MAEYKLLQFRPGVNTQATPTLNANGWSSSNLVRWRDGLLEKVFGWTQLFATAIAGICRGLHAYQGLDNDDYLLIGTENACQVYFAGTLYNIQLGGVIRNLSSGWLNSTASSNVYTVHDPSHGRSPGDLIQIVLPAQVGGITLFPQVVTVASVLDADHYTFVGNRTAVSLDSNGNPPLFQAFNGSGNVHVTVTGHGLNPGDIFTVQLGLSNLGGIVIAAGNYSAGTIDADTISLAFAPQRADSDATQYELVDASNLPLGRLAYPENIPTTVNNWFLDNFGNIALLCFEDGPIFTWTPPPSAGLLAPELTSPAPQAQAGMFVAMPQAQIISFGSETNGVQDSLLLRWCDAGDYTVWTADADNQAGSFRLSRGSKIVGAMQAPQVTLVWTDVDLWAMQYAGPPFVYDFNILGAGCGLISARAATSLYSATYWMSQNQFYRFTGAGVEPLPCPVWDVVFSNISRSNVGRCFAASDAPANEVWFFYPSASGTGEVDSYVKYNAILGTWDYGSLARTAWIDQSIFGTPIATDTSLIVQQHETGYDANGSAMTGVFAQTGYMDISDGTELVKIDQIIPDFKWFGSPPYGSIQMTVYATNYPGQPAQAYGPYTITPTTTFIPCRIRARQAAFKFAWSNNAGFSARLGAIRLRIAPSGRR